jgi:hypothetical protein
MRRLFEKMADEKPRVHAYSECDERRIRTAADPA